MPETKMGRPKAENPKSNQVCVRLTDEELRQLQETADQLNITKSEAVIEAVKQLHEKTT